MFPRFHSAGSVDTRKMCHVFQGLETLSTASKDAHKLPNTPGRKMTQLWRCTVGALREPHARRNYGALRPNFARNVRMREVNDLTTATSTFSPPRVRCLAVFFRLRQKHIDELKKQKGGSAGKKVGSALSALGRKFNKLTAQEDPELATEDHIAIEDEEEEEEEDV